MNMLGSILFMWSAVASYVLPSTGDLATPPRPIAGTLLGAVCFLVGAVLVFPAWRRRAAVTTSVSPAEGEAGPQPMPSVD